MNIQAKCSRPRHPSTSAAARGLRLRKYCRIFLRLKCLSTTSWPSALALASVRVVVCCVEAIPLCLSPCAPARTCDLFLQICKYHKALVFCHGRKGSDKLTFSDVRTKSRTRFRHYARRGVRGRQHQSDRQCCRHIGDGRNDSVTISGHRLHQLVAVSPDMLFGQFFCECHRQNAEMTSELHVAQWLSGRSWDAILSNVFVNYVYNVLPLQYPTISRQVGL